MGTGCIPDRNPVESGLLIASTDMVAADTLGCSLMGIDPQQVRTITLGAAAGLGESDLSRMDIVGEELKMLHLYGPEKPDHCREPGVPGILF
jgi:uncharacterized protein (DUF362 family)